MEEKRSIALVTPAWLYTVAGACFGIFAFLAKIAPETSLPILAAWLIPLGIGVLAMGILEFVKGEMLLGVIATVFGVLIALGGGASFWVPGYMAAQGAEALANPANLKLSGWIWLAIGLIFCLLLRPAGQVSGALFAFFIDLAVAIFFLASELMFPGGVNLMKPAGILILIFGIFCLYFGTAMLLHKMLGRPVLKTGAPIFR